jgi:hypothetical protein
MAVSKRLRYEILSRDGEACCKCGRRPPDVELQVDHVIPVALGGSDEPSNLQTLCKECNSGKSSVPPDAPLVAQVSSQAVAMAEALQIVAKERAANRKRASKIHGAFYEEWHAWTNRYGDHEHLPGTWKSNVDQLLDAGLTIDDLIELVEVAMNAKAKDTWKYFCGCCWRRLKQDVEKAAKLLEKQSPPVEENKLTFVTDWTFEDLIEMWNEAVEEANKCQIPPTVQCPHPRGDGLGHCGDPVCLIRSSAELYQLARDIQLYEWKRSLHADRINAAAEELEGALDG